MQKVMSRECLLLCNVDSNKQTNWLEYGRYKVGFKTRKLKGKCFPTHKDQIWGRLLTLTTLSMSWK